MKLTKAFSLFRYLMLPGAFLLAFLVTSVANIQPVQAQTPLPPTQGPCAQTECGKLICSASDVSIARLETIR